MSVDFAGMLVVVAEVDDLCFVVPEDEYMDENLMLVDNPEEKDDVVVSSSEI